MPLSKEDLESLIARSTDIVIATDAEGNVAYYNDGATRSLGYTQNEIIGRYVGLLYPDIGEAKAVMRAMRDSGHGGKGIVETFQTTFLSKDGKQIPVAISGTINYDESGKETGTVGFAKDLRDILHKDQLATLGEVALGLSHEINNPLAVILNQIELLEREVSALACDADTSVEFERLDAMRREVARISFIIGRLGEMVETEHYETIDYVGPARRRRPLNLHHPRRDPHRGGLRGPNRERRRRGSEHGRVPRVRCRPDRRRHAEDGRIRALSRDPRALSQGARADDDGLPLRQGPHHQAQPAHGPRRRDLQEAGRSGTPARGHLRDGEDGIRLGAVVAGVGPFNGGSAFAPRRLQ
jgi:PAS domain S-box-containing protein